MYRQKANIASPCCSQKGRKDAIQNDLDAWPGTRKLPVGSKSVKSIGMSIEDE